METIGKSDASHIKSYVPRKYLEVRINLLVVTGLCEISGAKPCETRVMICTQRYAVPAEELAFSGATDVLDEMRRESGTERRTHRLRKGLVGGRRRREQLLRK